MRSLFALFLIAAIVSHCEERHQAMEAHRQAVEEAEDEDECADWLCDGNFAMLKQARCCEEFYICPGSEGDWCP